MATRTTIIENEINIQIVQACMYPLGSNEYRKCLRGAIDVLQAAVQEGRLDCITEGRLWKSIRDAWS